MREPIPVAALDSWIRAFAELVVDNEESLTDLDRAIGDGDHGSNMNRGLRAAVSALTEARPASGSALFSKIGMTIVSTVGGASGPLFGTMFLRIGASLGDTSETSLAQLATALQAGLAGVVARGKAEAGEKTMLDALGPAVSALETAAATGVSNAEAFQSALKAAEDGRDATIPMLARKGRASYLGERSIGHQDPGATTVALLFAAAVRAGL